MNKTLLVAIAKDEGPYIREWVLYHKKICGFDGVFVYDNESTDDGPDILDKLKKEGMCDWTPWPRVENKPPQQTAYGDALLKRNDYEWICFLDIDEFLVINSGSSIGEFASSFKQDVGSISFNWIVLYSLDKETSREPVTRRINYCYGDHHVKTMARSKAIKDPMIHTFRLKPGYKYLHCSGSEYKVGGDDNTDARMCTEEGCKKFEFGTAHINHYLVKSEEDVLKKDERGDATTRKYRRKNIKALYRRLMGVKKHRENHSVKRYIETRYGLEMFYEGLK